MAGANVLPIIDTSASMTYSGYVEATKTDSEAFVRSARPGDRIGVVSYDTSGRVTYPPGGTSLVEVDFSLKQTREAADAIQQLSFMGDCTNIGGGILTARTLMDSAPQPKGMVLLSDGYQNCGTGPLDPGVLPSYPIYSCAMGPYSDQIMMQTIAQRTGGTYYFAPTVFDMMLIFNQIRGELDLAMQVVTNVRDTVSSGGTKSYGVPLTAELGPAQFSFVWNDASVAYTGGTPDQNQVLVTLTGPNGNAWPEPPQVIDAGYVIFNVPAAERGTWILAAQFGATTQAEIPVTAGGFEFDAPIALTFTPPDEGCDDHTSLFSLTLDGETIENITVQVARLEPLYALFAEMRKQVVSGEPPSDTLPEVAARIRSGDVRGGNSATYRAVVRGTTATGIAVQRTKIYTVVSAA